MFEGFKGIKMGLKTILLSSYKLQKCEFVKTVTFVIMGITCSIYTL